MSMTVRTLPEQRDQAPLLLPSAWCTSAGKRVFDLVIASLLLLVFSPILVLVAVVVVATSEGPVFFRQLRVGKAGEEFTLIKFRTMRQAQGHAGPSLTRKGDSRITALGRVLRRLKLDELPQLVNVMRGEMSLVGPRPDLAEYVRQLPSDLQQVLSLRPGVTGVSSLTYVNEEEILSKVPPQNLTEYYVSTLFPRKVRLDLDYARHASLLSDLGILIRTVGGVCRHSVEVC